MKIISKHSYMVSRSEKVMWHCSERGVCLPFLALDEQEHSAVLQRNWKVTQPKICQHQEFCKSAFFFSFDGLLNSMTLQHVEQLYSYIKIIENLSVERVITILTLHGAAAVFTGTEIGCTGQYIVCWMPDNAVSARISSYTDPPSYK